MNPESFHDLKTYVGFDARDVANITEMAESARSLIPGIVDRFYEVLLQDPDASAVIKNDEQVARLKTTLVGWLREVFSGRYDGSYFQSRFRIGKVHVAVGLPQRFMPLAMEVVRSEVFRSLTEADVADVEPKLESLQKLLSLDLTIMLASYQESYSEKIRTAEKHVLEGSLARAQHLAEIGQLAASLAHEIKNPLAGISGAIQVIGGSLPQESPYRSIVRDILAQITRLDATVKDLLLFARPAAPLCRRVKTRELIRRVVSVLREEPALQEVDVRCHETDALIDADEAQLEQLLMNLILNAAHASADGATIDVTASDGEDCVELIVKDSGSGMTPESRARALEPFYTTKAKGTGLGLAICRRIAEAHGGCILIDSERGRGTTITVRLPRVNHHTKTETT
jgi:two-component system, NtrC family, sensor histidine kinase HydH